MKNQIEQHQQETALANRLYSGETEKPEKHLTDSPELLARKRLMVWLWAKMGHLFGGVWEASYGKVTDSPIKSWLDGLGIFTEAEIRGGVELCEKWDGKFPPTFPEFRALCLSARSTLRSKEEARSAWESGQSEVKQLSDLTRVRKTDGPIARREKERMAQIADSPTSRVPTEGDVESFEESYCKLGLNRVRGALPK